MIFLYPENEEYKTTLINFAKYKLIMFIIARIAKYSKEEQNKVAMYLVNSV